MRFISVKRTVSCSFGCNRYSLSFFRTLFWRVPIILEISMSQKKGSSMKLLHHQWKRSAHFIPRLRVKLTHASYIFFGKITHKKIIRHNPSVWKKWGNCCDLRQTPPSEWAGLGSHPGPFNRMDRLIHQHWRGEIQELHTATLSLSLSPITFFLSPPFSLLSACWWLWAEPAEPCRSGSSAGPGSSCRTAAAAFTASRPRARSAPGWVSKRVHVFKPETKLSSSSKIIMEFH